MIIDFILTLRQRTSTTSDEPPLDQEVELQRFLASANPLVRDIQKAALPSAVDSPPLLPALPSTDRAGPPPQMVRVSLQTQAGNQIKALEIPAKARRPSMTIDGHLYQCSHQDPDGLWVYRRIFTERGTHG